MQNFMKTILSGVQTWTKGKIKESAADWNQNDESADNYVKNRPFYIADPAKMAVVSETFSSTDGYYECTGKIVFEVGKTYTVNFDGVEYDCVAFENSKWDAICLGNASLVEMSNGDGKPFCFDGYTDGWLSISVAEDGTHSFSIYDIVEKIHTIPEHFIPESVPVYPGANREHFGVVARITPVLDDGQLADIIWQSGEITVQNAKTRWETLKSIVNIATSYSLTTPGDSSEIFNTDSVEFYEFDTRGEFSATFERLKFLPLENKLILAELQIVSTYDYETESWTITTTRRDGSVSVSE